MDATIARLQEELSRLSGPARMPVLKQLGEEFVKRYMRIGPGSLSALGQLSAAIEVLDEAYHLMNPADPARSQVGGQLGWLLYARSGIHGGGEADRERAMVLIREALTPGLPSMFTVGMRVAL